MDSSYISFSGIRAAESLIATSSNNISNMSTGAYKAKVQEFSTLVKVDATKTTGVGVSTNPEAVDFTQGKITSTGSSLDIAIDGQAFFELENSAGEMFLTRGGTLFVDDNGFLQLKNGYSLRDRVLVSSDIVDIKISDSGIIQGISNAGEVLQLGQLSLVGAVSLQELEEKGAGVYKVAQASNVTQDIDAKSKIVQGAIELSNVDLSEELVKLVIAQNMYKANSNVININNKVSQWLNDLLQG